MDFLFVSYYKDFYEKVLPQFSERRINLDFSSSVERATQLLRLRDGYACIVLHYNPEDYPETYGISLLEHLALTKQTFHRGTRIVSIFSMDKANFFERVLELYENSNAQVLLQEQEAQT